MFDFGWSELVVILVVALVVIGPKELPVALRTVGQWVGRARRLAREFQSSIDEVVRDSELQDLRKQVDKAAKTDVKESVSKAVDPDGEIKEAFAPLEISSPDDVKPDGVKKDAAKSGENEAEGAAAEAGAGGAAADGEAGAGDLSTRYSSAKPADASKPSGEPKSTADAEKSSSEDAAEDKADRSKVNG